MASRGKMSAMPTTEPVASWLNQKSGSDTPGAIFMMGDAVGDAIAEYGRFSLPCPPLFALQGADRRRLSNLLVATHVWVAGATPATGCSRVPAKKAAAYG